MSLRNVTIICLKLGLSAGLIWFAFSKLDAHDALQLISVLPVSAAAIGLALLFFEFGLIAIRLRTLLAAIGPRLRYGLAFDAVLIGAFFSQTLISFVGGDAMRIWRMTRNKTAVGDAARAVLYDRVFGFIGLVVLIAIGFPVLLKIVPDVRIHIAILLFIAASVGGCILLLSLHLAPASLRRRRLFAFAARISEMGHDLLRSPRSLVLLLAISVVVQSLNVLAIFIVAKGLHVALELSMCLVLIPPVMFLSMMPISFAGWGVREGAMVAALATIGVPASEALALSISYGLGLILVSLPGGALWLLARRPHPSESSTT